MMRLRDVTIRTRLHALVIISTIGLAVLLCLSTIVLHQYRVDGPVHHEIQLMRQLQTDMEPSVLAIWRPHLVVEALVATTDPAEINRKSASLADMERAYFERYEVWKEAPLEPAIKKAITVDCHRPVEKYFRIVREELIPLVKGKDAGKAPALVQEKLEPVYAEYEREFDKAQGLVADAATASKDHAANAASFWLRAMLALSAVSVAAIGLIGWLTTRSITQSTRKLIGRVGEMAGGAGDLTARVEVDTNDEMAQLAAGINAMVAKIQSVVQRVREGSVQLLSTASEIAATARQQEGTVQGLSSSTTEIAAAVREISATSQSLADTMGEVSSRASEASSLAASGR